MSKYVYPAIFEAEDGLYNVSFPDIPDCYTCGDDLADAMFMAEDALSGYLARAEEMHREIPHATPLNEIHLETAVASPQEQRPAAGNPSDSNGALPTAAKRCSAVGASSASCVSLVLADTDDFRRRTSTKAVKKTLTIPSWMNEAAEAQSINFSALLQDALRQKLGLEGSPSSAN